MIPRFTYLRPASLREAIQMLASPGAHLHAGGTDLIGCLRDGVFAADRVVSMTGLPGMRGIERSSDGGLRIGALTTLAEIERHPVVRNEYAALALAARSAASPQLRNQGTIGGNVCQRPRCWYFRGDFLCLRKGGTACFAADGQNQFHCIFGGDGCCIVHPSDTAPALTALGASVRVSGPKGDRSIPMESFFVLPREDVTRENVLDPGEILTELLLPRPAADGRSFYRKARARGAWDFALAGAAVTCRLLDGKVEQARIVLSGVAPIPWRCIEAEKVLAGRSIDDESASAVAEACTKGARPLARNEYKVRLVRGVVRETLLALR